MNKEEQSTAIYYYFLNVVYAFYLMKGQINNEIFKYNFEQLKERAKELDLEVELTHNGGDYILIVEKPEEYVIVSADLDIYTYQDEENECQ